MTDRDDLPAARRGPNTIEYAPRPVSFAGVVGESWKAKLYVITCDAPSMSEDEWRDDLAIVATRGMDQLQAPLDHSLGFTIFHAAQDGTYLLTSRFNNANNLRHRVHAVERHAGELTLGPLQDPCIVACVWELGVMHFEAQAWIDCVLRRGLNAASEKAYLERRFNGLV